MPAGVAQAASVNSPASGWSPYGASPAHIASLVRAPLRFAKGACCLANFAERAPFVLRTFPPHSGGNPGWAFLRVTANLRSVAHPEAG